MQTLDIDRLNFDDWKEQRLAHCSFDVLTHVDNTTPKTTDVEWKKIDAIVKLWYGLSKPIADDLTISITVKDMGESIRLVSSQ